MYASYTAYETAEEVNRGLKEVGNNIKKYYTAPTIVQLIERSRT